MLLLPRVSHLISLIILMFAIRRFATAAQLRTHGPRTDTTRTAMAPGLNRQLSGTVRRSHHQGVGQYHQGVEMNPKDPRYKRKIIGHLTGALFFGPKCKRQFHRLYNNTRDCTEPENYKRCARLLIRLANSPRCAER